VPDRHLDERRIIEALRRTCADFKNKSAPRQSAPPIRFAAISAIDKAAKSGVIHRNAADRRKARLNKALAAK